ncbi:MAG: hypothetical protein KGS61_02865 [Verrucomicrobia bacterium]|nr:hypothetical protein [Verrucomicrobiota bacterium]
MTDKTYFGWQTEPHDRSNPDKRVNLKFFATVLVGGAVWTLASGCAVLTQPQVEAVKTFAAAAERYGTLPGEPIRTYAVVDRVDRLLIVSARDFSQPQARERSWQEMEEANRASAAFEQIAGQADRTLEVLSTYARLLAVLASDRFIDSLDANARSLARALDAAIQRYNEGVRAPLGTPPLPACGDAIAAVVRGGGGVWIRHQQVRRLRACLTTAQPVIAGLDADVGRFMTNRVLADLGDLEARLRSDFEIAAGRRQALPLATLMAVADARERLGRARQLCRSIASTAAKFSAAHAKLAEAVADRQGWGTELTELSALVKELQEARHLLGSAGDWGPAWRIIERVFG